MFTKKLDACGMGGDELDFIPIRVTNWQGVPGVLLYAECGLLLPKGWLPKGQHLAVEDEQGQRTDCQTNLLHAWPDGSAHTAFVIFPVVTMAAGARDFHLVRSERSSLAPCATAQCAGSLSVDTGAIQVKLDSDGPGQISSIERNGKPVLGKDGFSVTPFNVTMAPDGRKAFPSDDARTSLSVRENGLYRTIIHKTYDVPGRYRQEIDFYFYKNLPLVRVMAWGIRAGEPPAKLTRETAVQCHLAAAEPGTAEWSASRFCRKVDAFEEGIFRAETPGGVAHLVLPWFMEFGMEHPRNFHAVRKEGSLHAAWRPVDHAGDETVSPMNGHWYIDRYWREAALWIDDVVQHNPAALAVRAQLRFEGVIAEPAPSYAPESFILGSGLVLEDDFQQSLRFAQFQADQFLKSDYPRGVLLDRVSHNWVSAYMFGHFWRQMPMDGPHSGTCPYAMKGDVGEWLLDMYRINRDPLLRKLVCLEARAMVSDYGDGRFESEENPGVVGPRDDLGTYQIKYHEDYTPDDLAVIPGQSINYAPRDWPFLHLIWTMTGEGMFRDLAKLVMENLHSLAKCKGGYCYHSGDRAQHRIENLAKVAALFGDEQALQYAVAAAEPAAKLGKHPPWTQGGDLVHAEFGRDNVNMYTDLYMSTAFQLLYELTDDPDYAAVHTRLRDGILQWAEAYDTDGQCVMTIVEPWKDVMTKTGSGQILNAPNHFKSSIPQTMDLLIHDYLITGNPDNITRFNRLHALMKRHVVFAYPWGEGETLVPYHINTMEPGWEDHGSNCLFHGGCNLLSMVDHIGSRHFWACATYARALFQPSYHAAQRRLSLLLPWKLPHVTDPQVRRYGLRWPGGKLVYLSTARRIHVMGEYEGGSLAMRMTLPHHWADARITHNGRKSDLTVQQAPTKPLSYVDFEARAPFSLEIRRLEPQPAK